MRARLRVLKATGVTISHRFPPLEDGSDHSPASSQAKKEKEMAIATETRCLSPSLNAIVDADGAARRGLTWRLWKMILVGSDQVRAWWNAAQQHCLAWLPIAMKGSRVGSRFHPPLFISG